MIQKIASIFKLTAWKKNIEIGVLKAANEKARADIENANKEIARLNRILEYQDAIISKTKGNASLHILRPSNSKVRFAWLRIEPVGSIHCSFSVYHASEFPSDTMGKKLAEASIEFAGDAAILMKIQVHEKYQRMGIATKMLVFIERESLARGKYILKIRIPSNEHNGLQSIELLLKRNGFSLNKLSNEPFEFIKNIEK